MLSKGNAERPLSRNKRQETHKTGPLHGLGELPLVSGGKTRPFSRQNSGVGIDKPPQEVHVFVINMLNVVLRNIILHGSLVL